MPFGVPFRRGQSSRGGASAAKKNIDDDDDDPVKAMQNRMLHTALHNRGSNFNPPVHANSQSTRSKAHFSNVRPPRGTLCDEKLPYLDWRLSLLELQQQQIEERAEKLSRKCISYSADRAEDNNAVPMRQQRSTISNSTGSDLSSDLSSSQGMDALDYIDNTAYSQDSSWHSSTAKHADQTTQLHDDLYANAVLHQTLINNDALNMVPFLSHDSQLVSTGSGNADTCGDEDANSNEDNDLYYEAADSTEKAAPIPAPLHPASLYPRASFGLQSTSMEKASSLKLPKLFSRRPPAVARSQSHGSVPTSTQSEAAAPTTAKGTIQDKPKKKWTLLSLHSLGGSEAMLRETNMLR